MGNLIYSNQYIYGFLMRCLYGRVYQSRYEVIASKVQKGSSVLELCFGDLYLYKNYLKKKNVSYVGIDNSFAFIRNAKKEKIEVILGDVLNVNFPKAHTVIMQASLYQFIDVGMSMFEKMFNAAQQRLIIAEPVRNLAQSKNKAIALFANYFSGTTSDVASRYTIKSFTSLYTKFINSYSSQIKDFSFQEIEGGRELVVVIDKNNGK